MPYSENGREGCRTAILSYYRTAILPCHTSALKQHETAGSWCPFFRRSRLLGKPNNASFYGPYSRETFACQKPFFMLFLGHSLFPFLSFSFPSPLTLRAKPRPPRPRQTNPAKIQPDPARPAPRKFRRKRGSGVPGGVAQRGRVLKQERPIASSRGVS